MKILDCRLLRCLSWRACAFAAAAAPLSGCQGNSCNPPPILLPLIVPIALVDHVVHPPIYNQNRPGAPSGSPNNPYMIGGEMDLESLRKAQARQCWLDHPTLTPGPALTYTTLKERPRRIERVVYQIGTTQETVVYDFDLTRVKLTPPSGLDR